MERHGNSLTPRKVKAVKDRLARRMKPSRVAKETGVCLTTVYGIRKAMRQAESQ